MYKKVGNNIILVRGDSAVIPFYINEGTLVFPDYHRLAEDETFVLYIFGVGFTWEMPVITKYGTEQSEDGAINIEFSPNDTLKLRGTFHYCAKIKKESSEGTIVTTVVPTSRFEIID